MNNVQMTADKAAGALSIACAVHCLLLPLALIVLPSMAALPMADESFHQALLMGVIPVSLFALCIGYRTHRSVQVAVSCLLGLSILLFAALFGHDVVGQVGEKMLTLLGSVALVFGHIQNYKHSHKGPC